MNYFWPIVTGKTFFDGWSIVHLAFWIVFGSTLAAFHVGEDKTMWWMLGIALGWEIFERLAEYMWPIVWAHPESWLNSWISDPLMGVLGVLIGYLIYRNQ